jgi:ribonuclease-3
VSDYLVEQLERMTGHRFANHDLAVQSLTHTSYAHENPGTRDNERLEFIGDAVVNLCATILLADAYPGSSEGALTRLRQQLVKTLVLGDLGRDMGLHMLIRLGRGEARKANAQPKVVGCAVEAVIGAIYEEAGFGACMTFAERMYAERIKSLQAQGPTGTTFKDNKSLLQEYTQALWKETPTYTILAKEGHDHAPQWRVEVSVQGEVLAEGLEGKKDDAMKAAAGLALRELKRRSDPGIVS